jgi:hypothetical protein
MATPENSILSKIRSLLFFPGIAELQSPFGLESSSRPWDPKFLDEGIWPGMAPALGQVAEFADAFGLFCPARGPLITPRGRTI